MMSTRNKKTCAQIIKVSDVLGRKYNSIKRGIADVEHALEDTFKPITEPLKQIVESQTKPKIESITTTSDYTPKREPTSDCKPKKCQRILASPQQSESKLFQSSTDDFLTPKPAQVDTTEDDEQALGDIASEYLETNPRMMDKTYGARLTANGDWMIGDAVIKIDYNDLKIKGKRYVGTVGLYELLFKKNPKGYKPDDKRNYITIVRRTNAHKRNYKASDQIQGDRSIKWRSILGPALKQKTGFGIIPEELTVTDRKPEYIFWNDPNELVDRLRVLISSKNAGHTGHENEIMSILEELREADIIQ